MRQNQRSKPLSARVKGGPQMAERAIYGEDRLGNARTREETRVVVLVHAKDLRVAICEELAVSRGELGS
jgi:hypothetical protein